MEIISSWMLYLWSCLDGISNLLTGITVMLVIVIFLFVGPYGCAGDGWDKRPKFIIKWSLILCGITLFLSLLNIAIPSQKELAIIYVVPKLTNSVTLQQEAGDIYKMAKSALQEYLPSAEEVVD